MVPWKFPFASSATTLMILLSIASPALAAPQQSIHIMAEIDGRSRLTFDDATARWHHLDFAAPGRLNCDIGEPIQPTVIDGQEWWPQWPDVPTCENRRCECDSDFYRGVLPGLPNADFLVSLEVVEGRGVCTIVEYPSAANDYAVVVEFDDNPFGGDAWYEVNLLIGGCGTVSRYCTSTPNSTGQPATIDISGNLRVTANDTHLLAFHCPPGKTGIFFYGQNPAQIPMADGYLCVSPYFPGLIRVKPAFHADSAGNAERIIDFGSLPDPGRIVGGSTWCFQFWYRDLAAGGTGTNFSDAVRVTFCP